MRERQRTERARAKVRTREEESKRERVRGKVEKERKRQRGRERQREKKEGVGERKRLGILAMWSLSYLLPIQSRIISASEVHSTELWGDKITISLLASTNGKAGVGTAAHSMCRCLCFFFNV